MKVAFIIAAILLAFAGVAILAVGFSLLQPDPITVDFHSLPTVGATP